MKTLGMSFVALALSALPTNAQDEKYSRGDYGMGHAQYHRDFYSQWKQPSNGVSCCNDADCRPTQSRIKDGQLQAMVNGEWWDVPAEAVLPETVPTPLDLQDHVCANWGRVLCFKAGPGV